MDDLRKKIREIFLTPLLTLLWTMNEVVDLSMQSPVAGQVTKGEEERY
jgi:hypothetical protein